MRTKPLNPNSMQMIMENFRNYQEVLKENFGEHDNKIYLSEGKNEEPSHIQIDELVERFNEGKYSESQVLKIWEQSFDYEAQQIEKLFEEHMLQEQEEAAAGQPASDIKIPKWLEALGKLFNKGLDMLSNVIDKGIDMVIGVATKVYTLIARFKDKHPILFKIIVGIIVAAIALAVLYVMAELLQGLLENSNIEEVGLDAPLCGAGMSEAVGQCLSVLGAAGGSGNPRTITEEQYTNTLGFLDKMSKDRPRSAELVQAAQEGLTSCYEGAQPGEAINLNEITSGSGASGRAIEKALKTVNAAMEKENPFITTDTMIDPSSSPAMQHEQDVSKIIDRWSRYGTRYRATIDQAARALADPAGPT